MRRLIFFMLVSANGYYERGPWGIDWHNVDHEFGTFAVEQLDSVDTLVFGRKTYEGMASFWPSTQAMQGDAETAKRMNAREKIVFSRTLERADWENTRIARGDVAEEVAKIKEGDGKDALVLGSSDLSVTLSELGLIDEYRLLVNPIALSDGKPLFEGLHRDLRLKLKGARTFANGNVLLTYVPG
jgi:dihydrofolate reductase